MTDTVLLTILSALTLASVTVTDIVTHDIPTTLATALTALIGATAGVAVTNHRNSTTGNGPAVAVPVVPVATPVTAPVTNATVG